ncbi:MAG: tRNA 2-thiouridine(34) synthase MnmA [Planctomycetota bacterium]|nr:MAG: tRNA 2-thiouridine(34) synthase MnmA [Planctomycetota bacterium]
MSGTRGKVVVAMSGGVDSSVAACLLVEQGYEVVGLFMRTGVSSPAADTACPSGTAGRDARHRGCCSASDAADARAVAGMLGVPFYALNFERQFDTLIDYFADEYAAGRTPNPCIVCNDRLKFGRLLEYADAVGADYVATGHYARIERRGGKSRLCKGVDGKKDQSYVLFGLPREVLDRVRFPVGHLRKDEVRDIARRFDLPNRDKPDSVEICFVPDGDYARVVRERCPEAFREGDVVDGEGRVIGRHRGIPHYTIGQRRGLRIAAGRPIYVTGLDVEHNTVRVGDDAALHAGGLIAGRLNALVPLPTGPFRAEVKIRYLHRPAPATVDIVSGGVEGGPAARVVFDEPQRAVTPGQAAVFYDGDVVLGGGWIERALSRDDEAADGAAAYAATDRAAVPAHPTTP